LTSPVFFNVYKKRVKIMALKNSWQHLRQQRHQQLTHRRQVVAATLEEMQKHRQEEASQLRSDLGLFRYCLASDGETRRQELQQYRLDLHNQTHNFLIQARDRRYTQAQDLADQLSAFVAQLQQQTAESLALSQAERELMAQQLAHDLSVFRSTLDQAVAALQGNIQADIQTLQAETSLLRSEVEQYLVDRAIERQARAIELGEFLQHSELERAEKFQELSNRLAEFRAHLKQFVWGEDLTPVKAVTPVKVDAPVKASVPVKPVVDVAPKSVASQGVPSTKIAPPTPISALRKPATTMAKPAAASGRQQPVSSVRANAPLRVASLTQAKQFAKSEQPTLVKPAAVAKPAVSAPSSQQKAATSEEQIHEERVFQYIDLMEGARLTEIESSLDMSRFQTVEALRSLIQKGMITQRDRMYRVLEESVR
jgi:hypothetical protein